MDDMIQRAARMGVATEYWDAFGRLCKVEPEVLSRLLDVLRRETQAPRIACCRRSPSFAAISFPTFA